MNGIKGMDQYTLSAQLKSFMIFEFFDEYNRFENAIRQTFEKNIATLPAKVLQQLYFYYGGKVGTYIDYEGGSVKLNSVKYKENEQFKDLSINQIVKILKNHPCMEAFNFEVTSVQRATTAFSFYDCAIRLLNMRNKLAHEVANLQFKDQDLIELLSFEQLEQESFVLLQNYDVRKMDNMTLHIASNIVYMRKITTKLN